MISKSAQLSKSGKGHKTNKSGVSNDSELYSFVPPLFIKIDEP